MENNTGYEWEAKWVIWENEKPQFTEEFRTTLKNWNSKRYLEEQTELELITLLEEDIEKEGLFIEQRYLDQDSGDKLLEAITSDKDLMDSMTDENKEEWYGIRNVERDTYRIRNKITKVDEDSELQKSNIRKGIWYLNDDDKVEEWYFTIKNDSSREVEIGISHERISDFWNSSNHLGITKRRLEIKYGELNLEIDKIYENKKGKEFDLIVAEIEVKTEEDLKKLKAMGRDVSEKDSGYSMKTLSKIAKVSGISKVFAYVYQRLVKS